jgi:hypothetical protein
MNAAGNGMKMEKKGVDTFLPFCYTIQAFSLRKRYTSLHGFSNCFT